MNKFLMSLALTMTFVVSSSTQSLAEQCISQGDRINQAHSLNQPSLDPYAHLLPSDLGVSNPLAQSYDLNLKPLVVNDLTKLQFTTYDSRSPGAGYTSPYLWDVGQGPGYKSSSGLFNGPSRPGLPYSPFPFPVRR